MPLPDIDNESWSGYQADSFSKQAEQRIGAMAFGHAAEQRITDVGNSFVPPQPAAPTPQPLPEPVAAPVPEVAPEAIPTPDVSVAPESALPAYTPGTTPLVAPSRPAPAVPPLPQSGGLDRTVDAMNAAAQAGLDPNLLLGTLRAGVQMPDLFQAATNLKGKIDEVGGDLIGGLQAFGADPQQVLGQVHRLTNPEAFPAANVPTSSDSLTRPAGGPGGPGWLETARSQLDKPYIWGSAGGRSNFGEDAPGFDCSGFVSFVYKNAFGVNLPAQTSAAYAATKHLDAKDAQPGDIVEYNMDDPDPHVQHIAIYLGDGKVIQAGGGVSKNVNIAPIGQAGTYEFRRADGLDTTKLNAAAVQHVASTSILATRDGTQVPAAGLALDGASDRVRGNQESITAASQQTGAPSAVIAAIMDTENGGPSSLSSAGAQGFMQLMPATSQRFGVKDPNDPAQNILGGAKYLKELYDQTGSWDSAAAAYFGAYDWGSKTIKGGASDATGTTGSLYVKTFQNHLGKYSPTEGEGGQTAAQTGSGNPLDWLGQQKDVLAQGISDAGQGARSAISDAGQGVSSMFSQPAVGMTAAQQPTPSDSLTNPTLQTTPTDMTQSPGPRPTVFDAALQGGRNFAEFASPSPTAAQAEFAAMTPEQQLAAARGSIQVSPGGVLAGGNQFANVSDPTSQRAALDERIAQGNPLRDVPFVGGATTLAAQMATHPENYMLAGGIGRVGGAAESAVGGGIRGSAANQATQGALFNATDAAMKPGATPQDIAIAAAEGAVFGGAMGAGTKVAVSGAGRLAEGALNRLPVEPAYASTFEGQAARDAAEATSSRYYHGTSGDYATPDATKFDPDGLFGPGYYLTNDARVASSYAGARGEGGANVHPVNVPNNLNMLRADEAVSQETVNLVSQVLPPNIQGSFEAYLPANPTGADVFQALTKALDRNVPGGFQSGAAEQVPSEVNRFLSAAGFDGIQHTGGLRRPLMDAAGQPITHDVAVVFPQSLDKVTSAFAPKPGATSSGGARLSDEEALTLHENLGQQWQHLDGLATEAESKSEAAFNPGLRTRYENEAAALRIQQDAIMQQADHLAAHGELPPEAIRPGLAEQPSIPGPKPVVPSEPGAAPRDTGHLFGEMTAAKKAGTLPGAGNPIPAGARPIEMTTTEQVTRLRLDKFPEEVRGAIEQASESRGWANTQRRGVISDAQSETMADDLGRTFDEWVKGGKAGKSYNAEELRALRNAVGAQAKTVSDLSVEVSAAKGAGNLTDNLLVRQFTEGQKLGALTQLAEGARAEWGRAGRAFRDATRLVDLPPDQATARIYKMVGGRENALEAIAEYQKLLDAGGDVVAQAKFWANVKNPPAGVEDWFRLLRYNSMLSGPRTLEVNVIGNALELPWRLGRDIAASTARGNVREIAPELSGMMAGFAKGRAKFLEVWSRGVTTESALAGDLPRTLSDRVRNNVGKKTASVLERPGRVMQGLDEWGHAMANEMALGRRAGVIATRDGLQGKAWDTRVAELLADPTNAMRADAAAIADRMVYRGEMGTLGRALEQVQKVPYLGSILLPFLRTVYHISARGVDRSPIGLLGTGLDVARGVYGPLNRQSLGRALSGETAKELPKGVVPLGERLGDNLMGSVAWLGFYQKAMEGNVSGAGPDDPEKRDMLRAQGWQPYSIKLADHWISYANWGPVAISLASAAATAEAQTYRKAGADVGAMVTDGMRRTTQLATEQSYLSGIGAVWKGLTEPDRYGSQFVGQFMTSLVPYGSALNTAGQAMDPVMRKPERENFGQFVQQSVAARLPWAREGVPEAQDQLGRPIPNEAAGPNSLNALRTSVIRSNVVLKEMLANGADVGDPPKTFKGVPLTPAEQRGLNTASGKYIEQAVQTLMRDKDYMGFTPEQKQQSLQRAVAAARSAAGGELMQRLGNAEIERRVVGERGKKVPVPIG